METCDIQDEIVDKVSSLVRDWTRENNVSIYNEEKYSGNLRNIMIRYGFKTGEAMVVIVTKESGIKDGMKAEEEFIKKRGVNGLQ